MVSHQKKTSIQIDHRVLLGFLTIMFVINAMVVLILWNQIMAGKNDFPVFYSNAQMVREGKAAGLYDFDAENSFVRRVSDVTRPPNNHLPYELLLFVPFTHVRFITAYITWTILSVGMLAGVALLLKTFVPGPSSFSVTFLTILGFFPVWYCLLQGQDSILLLFLFALSFWFWRQGHEDVAGFVLALGLFRPQLVVPFAFIAFLAGKWKFIRGFIPGAALVVALSSWVVGWSGMFDYAHVLIWQGTQQSAKVLSGRWTVRPGLMPTWRGFLWVSLPESVPTGLRSFLLLSVTFLGLLWAAKKMRSAKSRGAFDLAFAIVVAVVLLLSFHSFLNDFSLMILPLLIYAPVLSLSGLKPKKSAYWLLTLGFLFFLTPLYLAMLSTDNLGWFFLAELAAVWLATHWGMVGEAPDEADKETPRVISMEAI